jgi:hypothetical protein
MNAEGQVDVVKKDNRLVRAFWTIVKCVTRRDYYQHIRLDRVAYNIVTLARSESNSERVVTYAEAAARVAEQFYTTLRERLWTDKQKFSYGQILDSFDQILKAHPELVLKQTERGFSAPAIHLQPSRTLDEEKLIQAYLFQVEKMNYRDYQVLDLNDPLARILGNELSQRPRDPQGNCWLDFRCRFVVRAMVPFGEFKKIFGGYEVKVKGWQEGEFSGSERIFFIPLRESAALNGSIRPASFEITSLDLEAHVDSDGTCKLPLGIALHVDRYVSKKNSLIFRGLMEVAIRVP